MVLAGWRPLVLLIGVMAGTPVASPAATQVQTAGDPLSTAGTQAAAAAQPGIDDALREGFRLLERGEPAAAAPMFERALAQYETLADRGGIARTSRDLGNVLYSTRDRERAHSLFLRAIEAFQALDDLTAENEVLYKVAYSASRADEAVRVIERGLIVSRKLGDKNSEGVYLLIWGNRLSAEGDYASAMQRLQQSIECIEEYGASRPEARPNLALALTSLGRLYQSHGEFERPARSRPSHASCRPTRSPC